MFFLSDVMICASMLREVWIFPLCLLTYVSQLNLLGIRNYKNVFNSMVYYYSCFCCY